MDVYKPGLNFNKGLDSTEPCWKKGEQMSSLNSVGRDFINEYTRVSQDFEQF